MGTLKKQSVIQVVSDVAQITDMAAEAAINMAEEEISTTLHHMGRKERRMLEDSCQAEEVSRVLEEQRLAYIIP